MRHPRLTAAVAASAALAGAVALAAPASAAGFTVDRITYCSKGSVVTLSATPANGVIALSLHVNSGGANQTWSAGVVDNFTGVYGGLPRSDANGDFTVNAWTADQSGTDNLGASAINWRTGEVCAATLPV